MKKKKPTLTHYTKRLKKVRLARTITVIATLFVSGVVVAANVLPQVIKSNAAVTDNSNDVIAGGVDQWNGANAKSQLIQKVYRENGDQAQSARALYAKFGVTEASVAGAKFEWMYGPNVTGTKVVPNELITPYGNWRSFGRNNGPGFIPLQVVYGTKTATFYHKPFSVMHPATWGTGKSAEPVLRDPSATPKWFIALECGNLVVKEIPSNPTATVTKVISTVSRAGKTVDHNAAGFKLQLKDQIKYRLSARNGNVPYPAGLGVGDGVPVGTKYVTQSNSWPSGTTFVTPIPVVSGQQYPTWKFAALAANQSVNIDYTVEVISVAYPQICNFAILATDKGVVGATPKVCLPVQPNKPLLDITKRATDRPTSVKLGDSVSYTIEMTNTGTAAAPNARALDILKKDSAGKLTQTFVSLGALKATKISDGSNVAVTSHAVNNAASQKTYANGNPDAFGYQVDSLPVGTKLSFTVVTKAAILPQACDFAIANYNDSGNPIAVDVAPDVCIPVIDIKKPHITVVKTSPTAEKPVAGGQTINYEIKVKNTNTQYAQTTPVTVTDTFTPPGYATNLKQSSSSDFAGLSISNTQNANGFVWKIASIPAGKTVTIKVSATLKNIVEDNTRFCNNATITMTPGNPVITETTSTVCNTTTLIKLSKAAKYVNRGDDPQVSPANAGDEIQYTLTTTNKATSVATAYVVTEELADVLNYADVTDTGGGTLTGTKLIWAAKDIPAGGSITNVFKVKVKDPVPNNEPSENNPTNFDYNMFNNYGNDINIKINKPLIQQIVDVATNLPETGAASYALLVLFLGMSVYFFVRNKQLTSELAAATVEYQHQESAGTLAQAQSLIHPEDDTTTTPQPPAAPPAA